MAFNISCPALHNDCRKAKSREPDNLIFEPGSFLTVFSKKTRNQIIRLSLDADLILKAHDAVVRARAVLEVRKLLARPLPAVRPFIRFHRHHEVGGQRGNACRRVSVVALTNLHRRSMNRNMAQSKMAEVICTVDLHSRRDMGSPDPHRLRLTFPKIARGLNFDVPLTDGQLRDLFWKIAEQVPVRLGTPCESMGPMGTQELP